MLHLNGLDGSLKDEVFLDLPNFLQSGDLVVFNDTRVIKARLFGQKHSGGNVEVLIERVIDKHTAYAHIRASRAPKVGSQLRLSDAFDVEVTARHDDLFELLFLSESSVLDLLEQYGALPLPPYITHEATSDDEERYQTVFSKNLGAVAAPTAGLHFNELILNRLKDRGIAVAYVTLHVGAGTFQPVRVDNINEHKMHSEIELLEEVTARLGGSISSGSEEREVECELRKDYVHGNVTTVRSDTGEVVDERTMTADERQECMPFAPAPRDPAKGKGGDPFEATDES